MKQIVRLSLLIGFVMITLSSCKNNIPKEAGYIPKEAGFVLSLDPQQMKDKLQKGGISIDTLLQRIFRNDKLDSKDKARFNQLKDNAGIDWNSKIFAFMIQKINPDNSVSNSFSLLGTVNDASLFESYLKLQDELKGKEIKKEKDYSYLFTGNSSILAWNNQQVIATIYMHTRKPVYDTVAMTFKQPAPINMEAEMKREVGRYFTQKVNESLASVDIFTDMFKEKADGFVFAGTNGPLAGLSSLPLQIPKLEELLKDNYVTATLSFDEGKIVAKSTGYTNELLGSVLKQYAGPTVNLSLIESYPSPNINAIVLAAFNPEIFGGLLKQLEVEGLVNNLLDKSGVTSQDLYKSLKGDIAVVISDFDMAQKEPQFKTDEKSMIRKKPIGKMIVTAPVGDKISFIKLMDKAVEQGVLKKVGNTYKAGRLVSLLGLYIMADEKNLVVASDSLTYTAYISKRTRSVINEEALHKFKGKSAVFYVDIAGTLNGLSKESTGDFNKSLNTAKTTFKDIIATTDNFDGKNSKAALEIRLRNEQQNSLVTLTGLLADIAVDMRVQARREKETEEKLFPGGLPAIIRTN